MSDQNIFAAVLDKVRAATNALAADGMLPAVIDQSRIVVEPPAGIATVADLMTWLSRRGEEYAHAFENPKVIRAAIDRTHVRGDAAILGAREIAFFPPMTGG